MRDVDSQTTTRVSLPSTPEPAISGDGQVVAYERHVGDTESTLFVRSWLTGGITGELENIEQVGFDPPSLSFDGRYVAFGASPTVAQSDGYTRIYHLDTESGDLVAVSVDDTPAGEHRQAFEPSISNDGNFVAFIAPSAILSADVNDKWDVVLRDIAAGTTQLVSVSTAGVQSNEVSDSALVAGDGRYVVFSSRGTNLVPDDTNDTWDAFVRDTVAGTTKRVSITSDGSQAEGLGSAVGISADGRFVVYRSDAPIMPGSADLETNLYVVDVSRLP